MSSKVRFRVGDVGPEFEAHVFCNGRIDVFLVRKAGHLARYAEGFTKPSFGLNRWWVTCTKAQRVALARACRTALGISPELER